MGRGDIIRKGSLHEVDIDFMDGFDGNDIMSGDVANDDMFGNADNDFLRSLDLVVNNDNLDGGANIDTCNSDPDPEVNCEI
jgi:hypothetical protein